MTLHDLDSGGVTDICVTADLKHMVECGMDGNVFVYTFDLQTVYPQTSEEMYLLKVILLVYICV